jgi:hypothetical protein
VKNKFGIIFIAICLASSAFIAGCKSDSSKPASSFGILTDSEPTASTTAAIILPPPSATLTLPVASTTDPTTTKTAPTPLVTTMPKIFVQDGAISPLDLTIATGTSVDFVSSSDDCCAIYNIISDYPFTISVGSTGSSITFPYAGVYKFWLEDAPSIKGTITVT